MDNRRTQTEIDSQRESTKYSPMVTVITPVLDGVEYLTPCIESVLNQSYPHIEQVFIDGGSTDGTVDILSSYSIKYPDRVRYVSEPDAGPWDAVNKGIRMAKGEIFGVLGSDDMYEPDVIQTVVEFFRANPYEYVVFGDCNYIDEKGEVMGRSRATDFNLKKMINDKMYIIGTSIFYKREVCEKIGLFTALACDFDFLIRAGKVFQIHRIAKVLSNFRAGKKWVISGSGFEGMKLGIRDSCSVSRRHGGSIFSGYCRLYYAWIIIDLLRPILHPIYPFIGMVLEIKRYKTISSGLDR